jgi:hypothetical protein
MKKITENFYRKLKELEKKSKKVIEAYRVLNEIRGYTLRTSKYWNKLYNFL